MVNFRSNFRGTRLRLTAVVLLLAELGDVVTLLVVCDVDDVTFPLPVCLIVGCVAFGRCFLRDFLRDFLRRPSGPPRRELIPRRVVAVDVVVKRDVIASLFPVAILAAVLLRVDSTPPSFRRAASLVCRV